MTLAQQNIKHPISSASIDFFFFLFNQFSVLKLLGTFSLGAHGVIFILCNQKSKTQSIPVYYNLILKALKSFIILV